MRPFFFLGVSDTPGDSGSQLPYQESPPQSPGPYLIGISHFPIQVDFGCVCPLSRSFLPSSQRWGVAPGWQGQISLAQSTLSAEYFMPIALALALSALWCLFLFRIAAI